MRLNKATRQKHLTHNFSISVPGSPWFEWIRHSTFRCQWRSIFFFSKRAPHVWRQLGNCVYPDNIHTHYVNKSLWNGKQYHFFVDWTKLTASIGLKYRIGGQIAWCGGVPTSKIYIFLFHYHYQVQFAVFLCKIILRNEFHWNVAAVFTLTITNFTLIGYYPHYINSSPLSWKQYRFVPEETKQQEVIYVEHVYLVNYKRYWLITFILTMSINHPETETSTISSLNQTKRTAFIGLKYRISGLAVSLPPK